MRGWEFVFELMQPRGTHDRCQRTRLLFFVWGSPPSGDPPLPCATSSKISPWFPLPWAAFYPIFLHYKTLCFSLDCRLPEGMTVLIHVSVPRLDPGKLPTHMKRSWKNGWMDDFCTMWRTQLSEIFLRKIIPLHIPMQSLSSTWTISVWTRDKDDKAHLLGRTRKNYKKSESSYSVSDSEPRRVPICSIGKIWFCLFFFFFEKLAQTLCQSEYSLCPQKSMLLSQ